MPDKLTDSEILKILETSIRVAVANENSVCMISKIYAKEIFDLINRQQAEIRHLDNESDALRADICFLEEQQKNIKAEAYKEFAEKSNSIVDSLLEKYSIKDFEEFKAICQVLRGLKNDTNNLLKELVGDSNV